MSSGAGVEWKSKSGLTDRASGGEGVKGRGKGRCVMMLTFGAGSAPVWCLGS